MDRLVTIKKLLPVQYNREWKLSAMHKTLWQAPYIRDTFYAEINSMVATRNKPGKRKLGLRRASALCAVSQ